MREDGEYFGVMIPTEVVLRAQSVGKCLGQM
jgi:hypothetical protein